jgi:hydroxyacylglutathione hydrolase
MEKIRVFEGSGFSSNSYLINGDKRVLIDPGLHSNLFEDVNPTISLDIILCTHSHYDHIAAIPSLQKRHDCEVWMGRKEAEYFEKDPEAATVSNLFGVDVPEFKINKKLESGEILDFGDIRLRIIETPGHSIGSICLLDEASKTLISGDTLFANGFGRYDLPGGDPEALIYSLKHIVGIDVELLYPGHGPIASGRFRERVQRSIELI